MDHIKLLIADDEPVILRGLKKLLPWNELGLYIIGEANDGDELRELIRLLDPQLIISDISMPGSNGIDIMNELSEQGHHIPVVFISAFQEFNYACQAIKLGALDYLIKPIDKNQLEKAVYKAVDMIRKQSNGERNQEKLDYYEQKNHMATIEQLLSNLLEGNEKALYSLVQLKAIDIDVMTTVCVLEIKEYAHNFQWEEKEYDLLHFAMSNIIRETLEQNELVHTGLFMNKDGRFVLLLQHQVVDIPLKVICDLQLKIQKYLKTIIWYGIGETQHTPDFAQLSYHSALTSFEKKYFTDPDNQENELFTNVLEDISIDSPPYQSIKEIQDKLVRAWISLDKVHIHLWIKKLFDRIRIESDEQKHVAISNMYHSILTINHELLQVGSGIEQLNSDHELLRKLDVCSSYTELTIVAKQVLLEILESVHKSVSKEQSLLTEVKSYIHTNYAGNLTLESVAARVYMNPYYFSSFFKKHIGQNFKNYVTTLRMKHALKLLLETDLLVYEIAEQVGYNNVRNFSDMFKKNFGKVPQEYRQASKL
ncbi:response regulator [Paenibacillus kyungheensis]